MYTLKTQNLRHPKPRKPKKTPQLTSGRLRLRAWILSTQQGSKAGTVKRISTGSILGPTLFLIFTSSSRSSKPGPSNPILHIWPCSKSAGPRGLLLGHDCRVNFSARNVLLHDFLTRLWKGRLGKVSEHGTTIIPHSDRNHLTVHLGLGLSVGFGGKASMLP